MISSSLLNAGERALAFIDSKIWSSFEAQGGQVFREDHRWRQSGRSLGLKQEMEIFTTLDCYFRGARSSYLAAGRLSINNQPRLLFTRLLNRESGPEPEPGAQGQNRFLRGTPVRLYVNSYNVR